MNVRKICVYAICKNESQFVERWYESMKEADYVVVLDTGSTDDTIERLKEVGVDRVEQKIIDPWRFDVARNESLKLVPKDTEIFVCTDLDEVFEPGWAYILKHNWNFTMERAEYKYTWSHYEDGRDNQTFMYNKIHSKNWIWTAPVHEYLVREDTKSENYSEKEVVRLSDKIHLHHYPDPSKSRSNYLDLLKMRVDENPKDYMGILYLAREYYFHGMYSEAISLFNIVAKDYTHYSPLARAYAHYAIGNCFRDMSIKLSSKERKDCVNNAISSYEKGIEVRSDYISNYIGLAYVLNEIQDNILALHILHNALKKCRRYNHWLEDGSNWTYHLLNNLAVASNRTGDKVKAIGYASLAVKYAPNNSMIKNNYNICLKDALTANDLL